MIVRIIIIIIIIICKSKLQSSHFKAVLSSVIDKLSNANHLLCEKEEQRSERFKGNFD